MIASPVLDAAGWQPSASSERIASSTALRKGYASLLHKSRPESRYWPIKSRFHDQSGLGTARLAESSTPVRIEGGHPSLGSRHSGWSGSSRTGRAHVPLVPSPFSDELSRGFTTPTGTRQSNRVPDDDRAARSRHARCRDRAFQRFGSRLQSRSNLLKPSLVLPVEHTSSVLSHGARFPPSETGVPL